MVLPASGMSRTGSRRECGRRHATAEDAQLIEAAVWRALAGGAAEVLAVGDGLEGSIRSRSGICEQLAVDPRVASQRLREMAGEIGFGWHVDL
jgi:hypothetical protein